MKKEMVISVLQEQINYYNDLAKNPGTYFRGGSDEEEALIDRYMARVSAYEEALDLVKQMEG